MADGLVKPILLMRFLTEAAGSPWPPAYARQPSWEALVRRACQYGASYDITSADYEVLRKMTIGEVFAPGEG
jgi:hypothetical protein